VSPHQNRKKRQIKPIYIQKKTNELDPNQQEKWLHRIALTMIPKVGGKTARNLVSYCGGIDAIFKSSKKALAKVPGVGEKIIKTILDKTTFQDAEKELKFIEENNLSIYFYTDQDFPSRLKECEDGPILFYYKGKKVDFNQKRVLSIVGTRNATEYGKEITNKIVKDLAPYDVLIVSGLAYGIDIAAHKAALEAGLKTIAVLAHGLDRVYPAQHKKIAKEMTKEGGYLSEFKSYKEVERGNFPSRNRIIAGLSDATLVVETAKTGGSMISAYQANDYKRTVLAVPNRVGEKYGEGCNLLIKEKIATLIESAEDLTKELQWNKSNSNIPKQRSLFIDLSPEEQKIKDLFKESNILHIEEITQKTNLGYSTTAALILNLEIKGLLKSLPGNQIKLII